MSNFGQALMTGLGQGAGYAGAGLVGSVLGNKYASGRRRSTKSMIRDIRMGHQLESEELFRRSEYDWKKAQERGLTPQEYYGSPASGGNPAPSGSAGILGNQRSQEQKLETDMVNDSIQRGMDRATTLGVAEIQKQSAENVAEISAGATIESTEIKAAVDKVRNEIMQGELDLRTREFQEIALKTAAAQLKISEQELNIKINEVANTMHEYNRLQFLMRLGVDNTIQNTILARFKVDPTDRKSIEDMDPKEYKALLGALLAADSAIGKNAESIMQLIDRAIGYVEEHDNKRTGQKSGPRTSEQNARSPRSGKYQ